MGVEFAGCDNSSDTRISGFDSPYLHHQITIDKIPFRVYYVMVSGESDIESLTLSPIYGDFVFLLTNPSKYAIIIR